ncbi:TonB-dependent receptor [Gracilimonas mengyeensis]|uniref:Iron complex outermembrane recepter protein n=1 Tax=Gracilimonas mengyeensis TaxID=1302730 RepID=A0A521C181_9BACT|nr:TonB-dependent receptor [Gracilimonas mengyeensis]SMO53209.1 iron complex outermembrane recepter protein [Gracilimonas mengyeensis]
MQSVQKTLLTLLTLMLSLSASLQANPAISGKITGKVVDENNEPLTGINLRLEGTTFGAASGIDGNYEINNVPAGRYTFVASGVGFETEEKSISITDGETLTIDVILSVANEELQDIIVRSSKVNKFSRERTEYVAKMPIENIENPQVYNTISSELLAEQVVTSFDDALTNAPGVFKLWESTGRGGDGAGYYSLRGFSAQPTMINGLPALTNGSLDPSNIERIEVIKGPSGTLYGSSLISYGGLINVVTKKPYNYFGGEIDYTTGSFGLNRVTADVNTPISSEHEIALRVNTAYHIQNSFQDAGENESFFIAPSLSYTVNDRISFLINTEFQHAEQTNPTMLFLNRSNPLFATNLDELSYNYENSYTSNDLTIKNPTLSFQGQMEYKLSENWTSQTSISRSSAESDGYYTYLWDIADGNGTFARYLSKQQATRLGTDIQQNFTGTFEISGIENTLVAGLDYFEEETIGNSTGYVGFGTITVGEENSGAGISKPAADQALASASVTNSRTEQRVYSAYVSDVINFTPALSVMASLRLDRFDNIGDTSTDDDNYDQTALSPKFGIVFQPIVDKVSLFANYMNGFSNVAPRVQDDGSTKTFAPEQANQWEAGVKTNLLNGRISTTLSYYDITVSDVVRQDPNRANYYVQDGENYSRGFEASVTAAPVDGLNLVAGYSYNDSEVTKTDNANYLGRRPESAGPKNLFNFWASYRVSTGALNGLGVGAGANYIGENKIMNRASTGVFALPSYTIVNASVFYDTDAYRIDFKVDNLTDQEYYKGWSTINPQMPRVIKAGFTYKF